MIHLQRDINFCWFDHTPYPDNACKDILNWAESVGRPACFIGTAVHEDFGGSEKLLELVNDLRSKQIQCVLIFDCVVKNDPFYQALADLAHCCFINGFLYLTWREIFYRNNNPVNTCWNPEAKRWLFLTGKANKPNRLRLLYKFHQADLLDRCIWSLLLDHPHGVNADLIPEIDDAQSWAWAMRKTPDNIDPCWIDHCPVMTGFPFDAELYSTSKFRVIAETNFDRSHRAWFTEKTWITIFNRVPFIFAGSPLQLDNLRCMGFRTFEQYLPINDYDEIVDLEQRLDAVVENTKFFIENKHNFENIAQDVEHNYTRATTLALQHQSTLNQLGLQYNLQFNAHELIPEL